MVTVVPAAAVVVATIEGAKGRQIVFNLHKILHLTVKAIKRVDVDQIR
jgi:hypothetical protein